MSDSPGFFTFKLNWNFEVLRPQTRQEIEYLLVSYFEGWLADAATKQGRKPSGEKISVQLEDGGGPPCTLDGYACWSGRRAQENYQGRILIFDELVTRKPLELRLMVSTDHYPELLVHVHPAAKDREWPEQFTTREFLGCGHI